MKAKYGIISLLGLAAVVAGVILARMGAGIAPLPYVLLGVGCGAFGWGAGELLRQWAVRADPGLEKQLRIEQTDERNQLVANKAKARAYDASVYIYRRPHALLCSDAGAAERSPAAGRRNTFSRPGSMCIFKFTTIKKVKRGTTG